MSATTPQPAAPDTSDAKVGSVGPLGKINLPAWLAAACALAAIAAPWLGMEWFWTILLAPLAVFLGIVGRGLGNRGAAFGSIGTASFAFGLLSVLLLFVWINIDGFGMGPYADQPTEDDEPVQTFTDPETDQNTGPQPSPEGLDLSDDI